MAKRYVRTAMPSFDVVSEIDQQEIRNAVDQAQREVATRYDFKGTGTTIERVADEIKLPPSSEDRLAALRQVLEEKLVKRKVSLKALDYQKVEEASGATGPPAGEAGGRHLQGEGHRAEQAHQGAEPQGRAVPGAGRAPGRHGRSATTSRR